MAKITFGEVRIPGDRFPAIYLAVDGKRYLLGKDASRFGGRMAEAARNTVSRVDIDVLREVIFEVDVIPLPDGRDGEPSAGRGAGMPGEEMPPASSLAER